MPFNLVTAPSFPQLLDELYREIEQARQVRPQVSTWVVAPNESLTEHLRLKPMKTDRAATRIVPVADFLTHLSAQMEPRSVSRWTPLLDLSLYELMWRLRPESPLAPIRSMVGGQHMLRSTFLDLADGGFGPQQDELLEEMIRAGDLKSLEQATLSLYRSWMKLLHERRVAWQPFLYQRLPEWISSLDKDDLASYLGGKAGNHPHLFLYGYYDLTDINTQLFAALATKVPVTAFLPLHRERTGVHRAFEFTQEIAQDLQSRIGSFFREIQAKSAPSQLTSFFLDTFPEGASETRPQQLTFQSASGPRAEVISAAVRIRTWMDDPAAPMKPKEILLLAPQPERYLDIAREVFDDFRIPLQGTDPGFSVEARILESLARIWQHQGSAEWVLSYLRDNPDVPLLDGVEIEAFESKIRALGLWGGEGWRFALEGTDLSKSFFSSAEQILIRGIYDCWIRSLESPRITLPKALRLLRRIQENWLSDPSLLDPLLSSLAAIQRQSHSLRVSPSFLQTLFQNEADAIQSAETTDPEAVALLSMMRARGMTARGVVILGLAGGFFPFLIQEDPLLSDGSRRRLVRLARDVGHRLSIKDQSSSEMALLFFLLNTSARSVHWIIPESDESGRTLAPTPWVQRYLQKWNGEYVDSAFIKIPSSPVQQALYLLNLDPERGSLLPPQYAKFLKHRFPEWSPSEVRAATPAGDGISVGNLPRDWPEVNISELNSQGEEVRLSVSALELLARCPFRFYAARVAQLQGLKPLVFSESIEALQRGQLIHLLLEKISEPHIRQNRSLGEMAQDLLKDNSFLLRSAVASLPRHAPQILAVLSPVLRSAVLNELRTVLEHYLNNLTENGRSTERLIALEKPVSQSFPGLEGVRITGKIDWVGQDAQNVHIVDYKSGKRSQQLKKEIELGFRLQPALYPWLFRQKESCQPSTRFSYLFLGNQPPALFSPAVSAPAIGQLLPYFRRILKEGRYMPVSKEVLDRLGIKVNSCQFCEYHSLCRRFDPHSEELFRTGFQSFFSRRFPVLEENEK